MLFPSEVFLFLFLPFVLAVYYLVLRKHTVGKNIFLFIMSLLFYAYGEPKYVFLMLFMILFPASQEKPFFWRKPKSTTRSARVSWAAIRLSMS